MDMKDFEHFILPTVFILSQYLAKRPRVLHEWNKKVHSSPRMEPVKHGRLSSGASGASLLFNQGKPLPQFLYYRKYIVSVNHI